MNTTKHNITNTAEPIKPGYKKTPVGIIPEDWEVKRISDLGDVVTGSTPKTTISEYYNGNELFVSPVDIQGNTYVNQTEKTLTELGIQQGRLVPKNSVLFVCIGSTIGKVSISGKDLITNQQINSIVPNKRTNFYFLFNILKQRAQRIKLLAANQAVPILNKSEFSKIKLPIPPLQEQKTIANCLSTWDSGIEKLTQLIQAKKLRKKGLMQQLLTGKKRLAGFDAEWEEVYLGELAKFLTGKGLSKNQIDDKGKYSCVLYGELYTTYSEVIKRVLSKTNSNEGRLSKKYDVLIPSSTTTNGLDLITSSCLLEENILLGGDIIIMRPKANRLNSIFFSYMFSNTLKKEVLKYTQGVTIIHLYGRDLKNIKIKLPQLEEQTAIAKILQAADREVEILEQKLSSLQKQKKGLMQVLLTGEKRLVDDE